MSTSAETPPRTAALDDLSERVAAYVSEVVAPQAAAMAAGDGDGGRGHVTELGRRGLAGLLVPADYGGAGGDHRDFAGFVEAVATECASAAVILDVHLSVATEPIVRFGSDEQKRRLLPRLARGEWIGAFALSEPGSGSDAASLQTRAEPHRGGYRLHGSKMWITNGDIADVYVVMARTGDAGARGISAFIVERTMPGVTPGRPLHKLGLRGSRTTELLLDGVAVPEANRLGAEGRGFAVAMAALDSGRIGISAQAVGIAEGALRAAAGHLRALVQVPAGGDAEWVTAATGSAALDQLGGMAASVAAARALTMHAAAMCDAGEPMTRDASIAKLYATDTAVAVAHAAVELCAPESAMDIHPASTRLRDAKACQIYEGTNQVQRLVIARELLRD
ncbi:MAG TPA: acyl-CoA dehydrogenase family protein [Candidatus Dormibacteraeota bacterium]|nr:acyl-CoA dehydrogenase family protein [Candidatus Dormibacteraeota bacterium]